jgi:predicted adenine nucleotide alpha hydrolase (AANH) superfamily ATPase
LRENGFTVTGFFYNPNIHPFYEYKNRLEAVVDFSQRKNFKVIYPEYLPKEYFQAINFKEEKPERCSLCWTLRLRKTARFARENGFTHFSTTLLVSPYQEQELLKKIGKDIAKEEGIEFYYEDFRPGFRKAHEEARAQGIYCQKYCGCVYSEIERFGKQLCRK